MKQPSFYKTFEETILAGVVDKEYNDIIGGIENHYYDTNELNQISKEELINSIIYSVMKTKTWLFTEDGLGIEPRHIHFIGKDRVSEIVRHRVEFRYRKEEFPEAFKD